MKTNIKANLRLLHDTIVICLHLDQRCKNVLIMVRIVIHQRYGFRFGIDRSRTRQIFDGGFGLRLPQLLQLENLFDVVGSTVNSDKSNQSAAKQITVPFKNLQEPVEP